MDQVKLEKSWKKELASEFEQAHMEKLKKFLLAEQKSKKTIYPQQEEYFEAFNQTPLDKVKVVIIGQDPYHGPNQAHGLCFSVKKGVKIPPSLRNIYKEQERDLGITQPQHGHLVEWSKQGVLLLNATLTVEAGKAGSHQKKGWEEFTDKVIRVLNDKKENLVFMLWGAYGQKKGAAVDEKKHLVLKTVHPSPLSAHRGFIGCGHFSKANEYLISKGLEPINWQVSE
ncbi:uracil-DNA glycosylase [bacterium]|nr:uracil-DNA glycosylase [bacterium]